MRSEREMYKLIIGTASVDERVRAVILDGSRLDPESPCDPFRDFDIIYLVTDLDSFKRDPHWIDVFGERMILQLPDDMCPPEKRDGYAYLMQFADGNRIDLNLIPVASLGKIQQDSIRQVLLDKDSVVVESTISDAKAYLPHPPTEKDFHDCCNEFWWVCPYAAKGLWRGQIPYAKAMLDEYIRNELNKMLQWYVGMNTGLTRSIGKHGKYLGRHLPHEMWALYLKTYAGADEEENWQALFAACTLFRKAALAVGEHYHLPYPHDDDLHAFAHLQHVHTLPRDAKEIY